MFSFEIKSTGNEEKSNEIIWNGGRSPWFQEKNSHFTFYTAFRSQCSKYITFSRIQILLIFLWWMHYNLQSHWLKIEEKKKYKSKQHSMRSLVCIIPLMIVDGLLDEAKANFLCKFSENKTNWKGKRMLRIWIGATKKKQNIELTEWRWKMATNWEKAKRPKH